MGVARALTKRFIAEERGELFGKAFEHFLFMELTAHASYSELDYPISFWRTKSGLEVDFILGGGEVAIEVKGSSRVEDRDLRPLAAFLVEQKPRKAFLVCNEKMERRVGEIRVIPWRSFLRELWSGDIIQ